MQDDLGPQAAEARRSSREERAKQLLHRDEDDLKWIMNDARGRRMIYKQLERAGVFRISYAAGDPHQTSFNEGQRNIGVRLLGELMAVTPEQYALMLREAKDDLLQ